MVLLCLKGGDLYRRLSGSSFQRAHPLIGVTISK